MQQSALYLSWVSNSACHQGYGRNCVDYDCYQPQGTRLLGRLDCMGIMLCSEDLHIIQQTSQRLIGAVCTSCSKESYCQHRHSSATALAMACWNKMQPCPAVAILYRNIACSNGALDLIRAKCKSKGKLHKLNADSVCNAGTEAK